MQHWGGAQLLSDSITDVALLLSRLILAGAFALAGVTKLVDRPGTGEALIGFGVPTAWVSPLAVTLPTVEIAVAVALLPSASASLAALAALAVLLIFLIVTVFHLLRGHRPHCHCFGQLYSKPVGLQTVLANGVLVAIAVFLLLGSQGREAPSFTRQFASLSQTSQVILVGSVLSVAALVANFLLLWQIILQQGRLLLKLETIGGPSGEARPNAQLNGLAVGSLAPEFRAMRGDGSGGFETLSTLLKSGKPLLLIFTNPHCGPCQSLAPQLPIWQARSRERLTFVLVVGGRVGEGTQSIAGWHGTSLMDENGAVAAAFRAHGTPSAVLISQSGTIASPIAMGEEAIRVLVGTEEGKSTAGLRRGDSIPSNLELLDTKGQRRVVRSLISRNTILLFWNPTCAFCRKMLARLKEWAQNRTEADPELLVIASGLTGDGVTDFSAPTLLDESFSFGRALGVMGTPTGIVVDGAGRLMASPAAGEVAIFDLLSTGTGADRNTGAEGTSLARQAWVE